MPRFEPFAAVRYNPDRVELADVVAPPYDVIGPDELARLEARSPYNVVHVDLARDEDERDRYEAARCRFLDWLSDGILTRDAEPSFYVYRMGWRTDDGHPRQTSGVIGALALDSAGSGDVLPHERTMSKPLDDRLRLLRSCRANVSPIWVLSLAQGLAGLCQPEGAPFIRVTDEDGVHHRVWRITAPAAIEAIVTTVGRAPAVIADGHHRYETALAYQAERRAENGNQPGPYDLLLTYVVELAHDELGVRPIHRLLSGLPANFPLARVFADFFHIEPAGVPPEALLDRMDLEGALGLVVGGQPFLLRPRLTTAEVPSPADSELLEPALAAIPSAEIAFHHDPAHVLALVDKGEADAAILLRPATVSQIADAARSGRRFPEKTTFFHPKARTGLLFRLVDE